MKLTLDDIWFDTRISELPDAAVLRRRRRYRASLVVAVGASYAIDVVLLYLFSWTGLVPADLPIWYACAGLVHVLLFSSLHLSGVSDRARNPHLTEWQMVISVAIQLVAMIFAPLIMAYFFWCDFHHFFSRRSSYQAKKCPADVDVNMYCHYHAAHDVSRCSDNAG